MARPPTRLILSFIGNTDLKFFEPQGDDQSPILRLLLASLDPDSDLQKGRPIKPQDTRLALFDDRAGQHERARFCERLHEQLPGLGLDGLTLERRAVTLPKGPTDLSALYEQVWATIPTSGPEAVDEVVFHLTSGTPAMHLTLMLASQSLRLDEARLFETSREQGVRELKPPYALALRRKRERERVAYQSPGSLSEEARKGLLKDSVLDDPHGESAYAALHKAAINRKQPQRVLIGGPTGSGKWHACKQFAQWRQCDAPVVWSDPAHCPELPEGATLLIRWLDVWPEPALNQLALLADARPDLAIAATVRTDRALGGGCGAHARRILPVQIALPALGARSDVLALGEALARQLGLLHGKLKERLQYDLLTDVYPCNLHDLKALLATAGAHSPGAHPKREAYLQARDRHAARRLLEEAWQAVAGMDFGPGRHRLADVLDAIRWAIAQRALADGRSQDDVGALLGCGQSTVSDILLKTDLNPRLWPSLREGNHAD
ncbi:MULTISPECIES: hypothetical protein [unclassified Thiocapsa]|uniref:hypothetical protein n=1 Tax=unclassified Thiocapsa TaxID=2641286 RepID=UPI0035AE32F7